MTEKTKKTTKKKDIAPALSGPADPDARIALGLEPIK